MMRWEWYYSNGNTCLTALNSALDCFSNISYPPPIPNYYLIAKETHIVRY